MRCLAILTVALLLGACKTYAPDAGHEIVLVEKPWFFGHGGVDPTPVSTGRSFTAITTDGVDVEMRPQRFEEDMPDTMTSDGVPVGFHAIITLQITDAVALIKNFGENWYANNVEQAFAQFVRQAVRKRGMNEVAINTTALDAIDTEVRTQLTTFLADQSLPVRMLTMTVGRANPPDAIKSQRIETAAQEQRVQTERQVKLAEDARTLAEQSRANADNAYREAMHLTPEQFIQLQRINMMRTVCASEKTSCTFIENGGAVPTLNLGK